MNSGDNNNNMNKNSFPLTTYVQNQTVEVLNDISEMGIDEIIKSLTKDNTLLEKIPIVKWAFLCNDIKSSIQTAHFIKKYSLFIGPIKDLKSEIFSNANLDTIMIDKKKFEKIIELTILSIDRHQIEFMSEMLGILFCKTFNDKIFSIEEYNTLLFSIELIHPYLGFKTLKLFYDYKKQILESRDESERNKFSIECSKLDFSPLVNSCLLKLPDGASTYGNFGGAHINELGIKFYENVVIEIL